MDTKDNLERTFGNLFDASCGNGGCSIKKPQLSFAQQLKQKYSFHNVHNGIMQGIMNHVISWIMSCFNKYDEKTFHQKMGGVFAYKDQITGQTFMIKGFDFISDWNQHHPHRYETILKIIRKTGTKLDRIKLYSSVIQTIQKHGWSLDANETLCFSLTINRLYNILYHNVDSANNLG